MPLWDSVQRSLEKASQEAARIAKTQRLRSTIDGLTRQIYTQHSNLLNKTMDLFVAGQLTQSELLPLCQELVNFQQQLNQAQAELRQVQASQAQASGPQVQTGAPNQFLPPGPAGQAPSPYTPGGEELASTIFAPPPPEYQSYLDSTQEMTMPPPPPGVESLTVSAMETMRMNSGAPPPPLSAAQRCPVCQAELAPNMAFCQNCGSLVQDINSPHLPTVRSGNMEPIYPEGQATVWNEIAELANPQRPANAPAPAFANEDETLRANTPDRPSSPPVGGAPPAQAKKDEGA